MTNNQRAATQAELATIEHRTTALYPLLPMNLSKPTTEKDRLRCERAYMDEEYSEHPKDISEIVLADESYGWILSDEDQTADLESLEALLTPRKYGITFEAEAPQRELERVKKRKRLEKEVAEVEQLQADPLKSDNIGGVVERREAEEAIAVETAKSDYLDSRQETAGAWSHKEVTERRHLIISWGSGGGVESLRGGQLEIPPQDPPLYAEELEEYVKQHGLVLYERMVEGVAEKPTTGVDLEGVWLALGVVEMMEGAPEESLGRSADERPWIEPCSPALFKEMLDQARYDVQDAFLPGDWEDGSGNAGGVSQKRLRGAHMVKGFTM